MNLNQLPSYTYIVIKYQLSKAPLVKTLPRPLFVLLSLTLSLIIIPLCHFLILISLIYKTIISSILRWRLQANYRGQLIGVDAICCNQERCTPSFFLFIDYKGTPADLQLQFINFLQHQCREQRHEKMFFSWSSFMGYHYYYKNNLCANDYVTIAQDDGIVVHCKKDLSNVIQQYDNAPMPDEDRALLHLIVYPQAVHLPNAEGTMMVCFKMHHALADAKAVISWITADLADQAATTTTTTTTALHQNGYAKSVPAELKNMLETMKKTLFRDKIKMLPTDVRDDNTLSGKSLKEEKYICWFSDPSSEYMNKIRGIRKAREGCTFLDVINTCISASLQEHYTKHTTDIPSRITAAVVLSPANYTFQYGDTNYTLSNDFSLAGFHFPIAESSDVLEKLNICQKEYEAVKDSVDVKFYYWLSHICSLLPYQIPRFCAKFSRMTIGVSSLPGSNRIALFGGNEVEDVVLMPPNSPGTALHFVITSYGKQLRISLTIDTSVVANFDDGQAIVDGIVKYLDMLHQATVQE